MSIRLEPRKQEGSEETTIFSNSIKDPVREEKIDDLYGGKKR